MRRAALVSAVVALALVGVAGCDGSSDSDATGADTAEQTAEPGVGDDETSGSGAPSTDDPDGSGSSDDSVPSTTLRPGVVELDGSIEEVLLGLDDARNFAAGIEAWLADVPGQEGVLRNSRGVTLFVPVDDGFSVDDRDDSFADPNTSALTLSDHLRVGVLDDLGDLDGSVVVASGQEYAVTVDDGETLVDGRRVLRTETASNGVIHLLDGPLGTGDG